jgi:hypothetical protein
MVEWFFGSGPYSQGLPVEARFGVVGRVQSTALISEIRGQDFRESNRLCLTISSRFVEILKVWDALVAQTAYFLREFLKTTSHPLGCLALCPHSAQAYMAANLIATGTAMKRGRRAERSISLDIRFLRYDYSIVRPSLLLFL